MLRIFLRYILEVEGLATKGFTKQQNTCYLKTLEVNLLFLFANELCLLNNAQCQTGHFKLRFSFIS